MAQRAGSAIAVRQRELHRSDALVDCAGRRALAGRLVAAGRAARGGGRGRVRTPHQNIHAWPSPLVITLPELALRRRMAGLGLSSALAAANTRVLMIDAKAEPGGRVGSVEPFFARYRCGAPLSPCSSPLTRVEIAFQPQQPNPVEVRASSRTLQAREDGLAHPVDTSRTNLASALALLSRWMLLGARSDSRLPCLSPTPHTEVPAHMGLRGYRC